MDDTYKLSSYKPVFIYYVICGIATILLILLNRDFEGLLFLNFGLLIPGAIVWLISAAVVGAMVQKNTDCESTWIRISIAGFCSLVLILILVLFFFINECIRLSVFDFGIFNDIFNFLPVWEFFVLHLIAFLVGESLAR